MSRRIALVVALILALVVIAAIGLNRRDGRGETPPPLVSAVADAAAAPRVVATAAAAPSMPAVAKGVAPAGSVDPEASRLGASATYAVESIRELQAGAGAPPLTIRLAGQWEATVVGEQDGDVDLRAVLVSPELDVTAAGRPAMAAAALVDARRGVGSPIFLTMAPDGRVLAVHLPRDVDPFVAGLLRTVPATLQLVRPDRAAGAWTVDEPDGTGDVRARYEESGARVTKTKERYLRVATAGGPVDAATVGAEVVSSRTTYTLADGMVAVADEEESIVTGGDASIRVTLRTRSTARLLRTSMRPDLAGALGAALDGLVTVGLSEPVGTARMQEQIDVELVAGRSLGELTTLAATTGPGMGRATAAMTLRAALRTSDAATAQVPEQVRTLDAATAGLLIDAAGAAGTPAAQGALAAIAGSSDLGDDLRLQALASLGLTEHPTAETLAALSGTVADGATGELADTGALALGNALRRAREAGDSTDQAMDALLQRLATAGSPAERSAALHALGNTGDPRALPGIMTVLEQGTPAEREAAVTALRLIPGQEVNGLLDLVLLSDPADHVRRAAAFAIGHRDISAHAVAMERALATDPALSVRLMTLALLAAHPGSRAVIAAVAAGDPDPQVRARAEAILAAQG